MTYTKKQRQEAIEACAMMASSNSRDGSCEAAYFPDSVEDSHSAASHLARAALWAIPWFSTGGREAWAEAECLLRDGWSPGDPVTARHA